MALARITAQEAKYCVARGGIHALFERITGRRMIKRVNSFDLEWWWNEGDCLGTTVAIARAVGVPEATLFQAYETVMGSVLPDPQKKAMAEVVPWWTGEPSQVERFVDEITPELVHSRFGKGRMDLYAAQLFNCRVRMWLATYCRCPRSHTGEFESAMNEGWLRLLTMQAWVLDPTMPSAVCPRMEAAVRTAEAQLRALLIEELPYELVFVDAMWTGPSAGEGFDA